MTALLIILGIAAIIFLLLICPLSFSMIYDDELKLKIRYLFFSFDIYSLKNKKNKKKKKPKKKENKKADKKQEESKKNPFSDLLKQNGIGGLIGILKKILEIITEAASSVTSHLVISKLYVDIIVVGQDAADTAMKFAYVCSVIYPLISFIDSHIKKCNHKENVRAGFEEQKMKVSCAINARIKPIFLIGTAISALFKWIKAIAK